MNIAERYYICTEHSRMIATLALSYAVFATPYASAQTLICDRLPISERETCEAAYESLIQNSDTKVTSAVHGAVNAGNWQYTYELPSIKIGGRSMSCTLNGALTLPPQDAVTVTFTATDVIHEWSVPALNVEAVIVPGRVESITIKTDQPGIFEGHSSFSGRTGDIKVRVLREEEYLVWVHNTSNTCSN